MFFTYSYWETELDVENYRNSELFINVWSSTKLFFKEKGFSTHYHIQSGDDDLFVNKLLAAFAIIFPPINVTAFNKTTPNKRTSGDHCLL